MWSERKAINIAINILLFLVGLNIFHYGQLLLPAICLILFIDNKFRLNIKDIKIFSILCLFGISFFIFTYKMGFYSIMGFCLPLAYYIGSNLKETNETNIKNIIYLLSFGMAIHVLLNMVYDFSVFGLLIFQRTHHYDIWTREFISSTGTSVNYTLLISIIYYIIFYEENKKYKAIGITLFVILSIYNIALGRRTPIIMLIIIVLLSYIYDFLINKNRKLNKTVLISLIIIFSIIALVLISVFVFNIFNLREQFIFSTIFLKFYNFGLNPERINLFIDSLKLAPNYLWGGQCISNIVETQIHDLWMDTYDYAGIIPFILLITYTIIVSIDLTKLRKIINNKLLIYSVLLCILMQMLLEPVMTGSSIFLICSIIIISVIQGLKYSNGK